MKAPRLPHLALLLAALALVGLACAALLTPLDSDPAAHRQMQTQATLQGAGQSMDRWIAENGRVPTAQEGLSVLGLRQDPALDGWGRPLVFTPAPNGRGQPFTLRSRGADGLDANGGGDDLTYTGPGGR